jgi:hypothetical protein
MKDRMFTIETIGSNSSGNIVSVYLGDPKKMGAEAEHVMTINASLLPTLIADIKNYQLNGTK